MASKMSNAARLKAFRTLRMASSFNNAAIRNFLSALDCPRALTVWMLFINQEHAQLVDLECVPEDFDSAFRFRDAYTATHFLSKANFLKLEVSRKDAALAKFHQYEELCKDTNNRFRDLSLDPKYKGPNVWLLHATTRKIEEILGDYTADEFVDDAGWGPGVSTLLKGPEVSAFNKFHAERGITRDLYRLVEPWFSTAYPSWFDHLTDSGKTSLDRCLTWEVGNKVVTVPKNSKTDRVIAIEPGLNIWFQKALGKMIRKRLRRRGVDLNSQERNQQLALKGSKDSSLATVDFSSASDSISFGLVHEVLPPDWFKLLDACRSKVGKLDDKLIWWEKFSAMGNGFTFELESLIFYAAALAVCEFLHQDSSEVSVFGDDVIIPTACFDLYSSFSDFLGFRVNKAKSFANTDFRESCGSHYWKGVDCKPLYLKERIRDVQGVYKLANGIRYLAHRRNSHYGCDARFRHCWLHLFRGVPESLRLKIPLGFGDGGFIANFDEACPATSGTGIAESAVPLPRRARGGLEGYRFALFAYLGVTRESDHRAMLITRLWSQSIDENNNNYTLRGTVRTRLLTRVLVSQWYNLGGWI